MKEHNIRYYKKMKMFGKIIYINGIPTKVYHPDKEILRPINYVEGIKQKHKIKGLFVNG